ncbi:hypothetical protein AG1IA_08522 [Rhizoctonia solani AG-1 IA]|uniref:Uncharacterized protein n=1 Tax=Thanatephorus cucumeris (strain AG1-IA) TaxID=983506 RepID=L8WM71_THACA|nr:hypothetical protein AG1IA_08522 [Rhizoctonia solani AG-1 IA]
MIEFDFGGSRLGQYAKVGPVRGGLVVGVCCVSGHDKYLELKIYTCIDSLLPATHCIKKARRKPPGTDAIACKRTAMTPSRQSALLVHSLNLLSSAIPWHPSRVDKPWPRQQGDVSYGRVRSLPSLEHVRMSTVSIRRDEGSSVEIGTSQISGFIFVFTLTLTSPTLARGPYSRLVLNISAEWIAERKNGQDDIRV